MELQNELATSFVNPSGLLFTKENPQNLDPLTEDDFADEEKLNTTLIVFLFLLVFAWVLIGFSVLAFSFLKPFISFK
jgi:hypothetical protein